MFLDEKTLEECEFELGIPKMPSVECPDFPFLFPAKYDFGKKPVIAIDTETTGLKWRNGDEVFAISMAWYDSLGNFHDAYWSFPVDPKTRKVIKKERPRINWLNYFWLNKDITKVFANAKFDMQMIRNTMYLPLPNGDIFDVLIAGWCCNTAEPTYKLNDLAEKYVGIPQDDFHDLSEKVQNCRTKCKKYGFQAGPNISNWHQDYWLPKLFNNNDNTCKKYALRDAQRTIDLYYFYSEGLKQLGAENVFHREMQVNRIIYNMETRGVSFNKANCEAELLSLKSKISSFEKEIKDFFQDENLNINSDKQMIPKIYPFYSETSARITGCRPNSLNLPPVKWTEGGKFNDKKQPSLDTGTLKIYQNNYPVINNLIQYRSADTGRKYCENYLSFSVNDLKMRGNIKNWTDYFSIHPSFNQCSSHYGHENKTATGRLSSSDPNLQNVADPEKSSGL